MQASHILSFHYSSQFPFKHDLLINYDIFFKVLEISNVDQNLLYILVIVVKSRSVSTNRPLQDKDRVQL